MYIITIAMIHIGQRILVNQSEELLTQTHRLGKILSAPLCVFVREQRVCNIPLMDGLQSNY